MYYINLSTISCKYAMAGKIQAPHTWIIMNHYILKTCHMYFHWYNVFKLRNKNVMEVRLIVNMPFKWQRIWDAKFVNIL